MEVVLPITPTLNLNKSVVHKIGFIALCTMSANSFIFDCNNERTYIYTWSQVLTVIDCTAVHVPVLLIICLTYLFLVTTNQIKRKDIWVHKMYFEIFK